MTTSLAGCQDPSTNLGGAATDKEPSPELRQRPGRMTSIGLVNVRRVDFDIRDAVGGHGVSAQMPGSIKAVAVGAEMPPRHDGDAVSFANRGMSVIPRLHFLDCEVLSMLSSLATT